MAMNSTPTLTLNVSDIQRFSVGDGPGIRTTVFLKGCNLRCPWCHNPETISPHPVTLSYPAANKTVRYGRAMTVSEVLTAVMEDADFYTASGGGATISGGEPLLQAEGVAELAKALKAEGVSVILDTAGQVPYARFERVLPYVDRVFFDWKSSDPACLSSLGASLDLARANLSRLIKEGANVHARIPLIPTVNVSPEAVAAMIRDLTAAGVSTVGLLPFHRLASGKYEAMGIPYPFASTPPLDGHVTDTVRRAMEQHFTVYTES